MIVVTGGAGFIGSALIWRLNQRGMDDILVVDHLGDKEKWKNLVPLRFRDYLDKSDFIQQLEAGRFGDDIQTVLHMGACSSTTEQNADYLMENNYRYTVRLAMWQESHPGCRFIYASSAATYGAGERGYLDDEEGLEHLRPLNMYGYSKHLFDIFAKKRGWFSHIVGLKYFNVYGPNEYHKADMRSVINKAYPMVREQGVIRLFQSHRDNYRDGEQRRDFIYINDAVDMTLFFLDHPDVNGLFNIGTGTAHSWNQVAAAMFQALGKHLNIEYIPMPEGLREKYQYHTRADTKKLRNAGCLHECESLESAVKDYILEYLEKGQHLNP